MGVSLTPDLESLVNEKVKSGVYSSASEVICEGLRLLKERDDHSAQRLESSGERSLSAWIKLTGARSNRWVSKRSRLKADGCEGAAARRADGAGPPHSSGSRRPAGDLVLHGQEERHLKTIVVEIKRSGDAGLPVLYL
jgi:putative addiction module CopG family antidote